MIKLFYVKDNYIVPQESQVPVRWEDIHGDISGNTQLQEVFDDLQDGIDTNAQAITAEVERAQSVEETLQTTIAGEVERAKGAETTNKNSIDAEATRATTKESELEDVLEQEITDRKNADNTLQSNIDIEVARATEADNAHQAAISTETTNRITADNNLQEQISANETALHNLIKNDTIQDGRLDALENTSVTVNGNIATINAKNAEQDLAIQTLQSNIDASLQNYYTKAESDNKYALKGDAPTDVYTKAQVDNKLSNKADKSEIPTIPLFRTINGQAITGSTDNIVIEGGSGADMSNYYTKTESDNKLANKQDTLVSGQNIKTINGQSIVGNGNITIEGGGSGADLSDYYTKAEIDSIVGDINNALETI